MEPIEVPLSSSYTLVLERETISDRWTALNFKMRNVGKDGQVRIRGGFAIAASRLRDVIRALEQAERQLCPRRTP